MREILSRPEKVVLEIGELDTLVTLYKHRGDRTVTQRHVIESLHDLTLLLYAIKEIPQPEGEEENGRA